MLILSPSYVNPVTCLGQEIAITLRFGMRPPIALVSLPPSPARPWDLTLPEVVILSMLQVLPTPPSAHTQ